MANKRKYSCLPCAEVDGSIAFYESLGFTRTCTASNWPFGHRVLGWLDHPLGRPSRST